MNANDGFPEIREPKVKAGVEVGNRVCVIIGESDDGKPRGIFLKLLKKILIVFLLVKSSWGVLVVEFVGFF